MQGAAGNVFQAKRQIRRLPGGAGESRVIQTTLSELIAAVDSELKPGEKHLLGPIVRHILTSRRLRMEFSAKGAEMNTH